MRCVCGRSIRPSWRFYRDVAVAAAALVWGALVARHDRDAKTAHRNDVALGDQLRVKLDAIRDGRWVQLRDGDTVVTVVRARTYRWKRAQ